MTYYRKAVWYVKGLREYTKEGYGRAQAKFNADDLDVDLSGRIALVTGANSGIGKVTAAALSARGATVHMVCRNVASATDVRDEIVKIYGNQVFVHALDLSRAADVVRFAAQFCKDNPVLHILVNNAGCMVNERSSTEDGLEVNFATNTLGTHLLTMGLLPALRAAHPHVARVVVVSSGGMLLAKLDPADFNSGGAPSFDGPMVYCQNKRQQVVLARLYAEKFGTAPSDGQAEIRFWSCHPGWADTAAARNSLAGFYERHKHRYRTAEQGADVVVWLAVAAAALANHGGLFFQGAVDRVRRVASSSLADRQPVAEHLPLAATRSTTEDVDAFWHALEQLRLRFVA